MMKRAVAVVALAVAVMLPGLPAVAGSPGGGQSGYWHYICFGRTVTAKYYGFQLANGYGNNCTAYWGP